MVFCFFLPGGMTSECISTPLIFYILFRYILSSSSPFLSTSSVCLFGLGFPDVRSLVKMDKTRKRLLPIFMIVRFGSFVFHMGKQDRHKRC